MHGYLWPCGPWCISVRKLSDFWADKQDSPYDAGQNEDEPTKDEEGNYVLTTKDVEDMDDTDIKNSFKDNPYEEEDI